MMHRFTVLAMVACAAFVCSDVLAAAAPGAAPAPAPAPVQKRKPEEAAASNESSAIFSGKFKAELTETANMLVERMKRIVLDILDAINGWREEVPKKIK